MRHCLLSFCPSLVALLATALGCRSARNPEMVVPPVAAQSGLRLEGTVISMGSGQAIVGASLRLIASRLEEGKSDTLERITQPDGAFFFDSLASGQYVLLTRSIGHRARYDTLLLSTAPPPRLTIPMIPAATSLGGGVPDSHVVNAARAQRARWICDRDPQSFNEAQKEWAEWLLIPRTRGDLGLRAAAGEELPRIDRVRDRPLCRRAAEAYDETVGATGLATTVFRFERFYLVSQPTWPTQVIFDEQWRPVLRTIQQ